MTRTKSGFLILAVAIATMPALAGDLSAGSIVGRITYDGNVPKVTGDTGDCATVGTVRTAVLVWVKNAPSGGRPGPPARVEIKDCQLHPRVVGLMTGQPLGFKNSDGILHNLQGRPRVNKDFNIGMPPAATDRHVFNKPEPAFPVKCDVHPWMNSYVAVMTHPYFAVTDSDGKFKIDNVPDGTYTVEAWHERLGIRSFQVEIVDGRSDPISGSL